MSELLTIYDRNFNEIGTADREEAHSKGLWHAVVHCWVVSPVGNTTWVWFQQRAKQKVLFPDYYDTAVGGHIRAGESPMAAVLRETQEELGLHLTSKQVRLLDTTQEDEVFPDSPLQDREFCYVFLYEDPAPHFEPGDEVQDMVRVKLEDLCQKEQNGVQSVPAFSQHHDQLMLQAAQFCLHPQEFVRLVLPELKRARQ